MKEFLKHYKKAVYVLLVAVLLIIVVTQAGTFFLLRSNFIQNQFSILKSTLFGTKDSQEITSVYKNPTSKTDCSEKNSLTNAKACTYLIGTTERHGSSFSFDPDGTMVTNYHVIDYSEDGYADVFYNGKVNKVAIIGFSVENDIAVLKGPKELYSCNWVTSSSLDLAEPVYAVGWPNSPYGDSTITKGIVSRYTTLGEDVSAIQTDTPINPGNSGGPLINKCGVVGINTSKVAWIDENAPSEGIGYAITSDYAMEVIKTILESADGSPQIPQEKISAVSESQSNPLSDKPNIVADAPVAYNYEQVLFWEQRKILDRDILENWQSAEKSNKDELVDESKLHNLLKLLSRSLEISETLWDAYTNSKLTYGEVLNLKQEYLENSNEISIISRGLNIEGGINAFKKCMEAWDDLEDEYNEDFSEKKKQCENFIDFN